jgi:hypothetical protein
LAIEHRPGHERRLAERDDDAEEQDERRGYWTPYFVEPPHRSEDAAGLLIDFDVAHAFLERRCELRRQLLEDDLTEVSARRLQKAHDGRVHHRLEDRDGLVTESPFEHRRCDVGDAFAGEDSADRQHRKEEPGDEQGHGNGQQGQDRRSVRIGRHIGCPT